MKSPSQTNSRKHLQQVIDAEIKSLQESLLALSLRRNALSPISSLPPEIFEAIFTFLCLPALEGEKSDHHQARLLVSHVCHQWREIALNEPFLWSNVHFNTPGSLDGATEILARAKSVPLHLKVKIPGRRRWNDVRFSAFQKELQARLPNVCHLTINAQLVRLHETFGGLISPAPTLEYLSLFCRGGPSYENTETEGHLFVPNTLFNGSAPRLSCLKLINCKISWKSPLMQGRLVHLEIRSPIARPKLETWLDALNAMTQLKTLVLHSASPIAASQGDVLVEHNVTLPSLTHLNILTSLANCALMLAHLDLPALTALSMTAYLRLPDSMNTQALLPHLARHAHGPQDTRPLQSMLICSDDGCATIFAWTLPDIDAKVQDPPAFLTATLPNPRVALYFESTEVIVGVGVLDQTMAALPLSGLVTLVAHGLVEPPYARGLWLDRAPKWPFLRRAHLAARSQLEFTNMLRNGNNESSPLLPLLKEISLVGLLPSEWEPALRKRAEQGVPLERLDLRMGIPCNDTQVPSLSKIVVDTLGPHDAAKMKARINSRWQSVVFASFGEDFDCEAEFESYTDDGGE